jgi:hypothetical protein
VLRIVPRTPSPQLEDDVDFKELNPQDVDELSQEQLRDLLRHRVKQETRTQQVQPSHSTHPRLKFEDGELEIVEERRCKRQRFSASNITGEVVDLC